MDELTHKAHLEHCRNLAHATEALTRARATYRESSHLGGYSGAYYCDGGQDGIEYALQRIHSIMLNGNSTEYKPVKTAEDITRRTYHVISDIAQRCINKENDCYSDYSRGYVDGLKYAWRMLTMWLV